MTLEVVELDASLSICMLLNIRKLSIIFMKIYVTKINETKLRKESLLFLVFINIRINYLLNISIHEKVFDKST